MRQALNTNSREARGTRHTLSKNESMVAEEIRKAA
jgi:hypothetical protein